MKKRWIIGTRGSKLALKQTEFVVKTLEHFYPDRQFFVKTIKTVGDTIWDKPLHLIGGKGLFVREIEDELLRREIDLAVHSMKDVPTELEPGLTIGAVLTREDPRDVFISDSPIPLTARTKRTLIGTNSLRRKAQILNYSEAVEVIPLRGNIDTRMRKMRELKLDGIILAYAGVHRMGFDDHITEILPFEIMVPSSGQGAVAVETRDEQEALDLVRKINDEKTFWEISIERKLQSQIGGSCQVPLGIHVNLTGNEFTLRVAFGKEDGDLILKDMWSGQAGDADAVITEVLRVLAEKQA
jgi:hydroxymethylbilane synthase